MTPMPVQAGAGGVMLSAMARRPKDGRRRFRYYFACSLDGYIADAQGGVGWLEPFRTAASRFPEFLAQVDTAIVGRKTFEFAMSHGRGMGMRTYVLTRGTIANLPKEASPAADAGALVRELRGAPGKDVWIVGGGLAAAALLEADGMDEIEMHVMPVVLGTGIPMLQANNGQVGDRGASMPVPARFALETCEALADGIVRLVYTRSPG
jgi:dihydrofolate reductase